MVWVLFVASIAFSSAPALADTRAISTGRFRNQPAVEFPLKSEEVEATIEHQIASPCNLIRQRETVSQKLRLMVGPTGYDKIALRVRFKANQ